jgi:hypothetical protein
MVVGNEMLVDRNTCFLSGTVHKLRKKTFYNILFTVQPKNFYINQKYYRKASERNLWTVPDRK